MKRRHKTEAAKRLSNMSNLPSIYNLNSYRAHLFTKLNSAVNHSDSRKEENCFQCSGWGKVLGPQFQASNKVNM